MAASQQCTLAPTSCEGAAQTCVTLRRTIRDVVEGAPQQLIESVAEHTAAAVLREHPAVSGVDILVKKPQAPMDGTFDYVGVLSCRVRHK